MKNIRRATRQHLSARDKIRIVLEGWHGEANIAEPCRHEVIAQRLYYTSSKEFMEVGTTAKIRMSIPAFEEEILNVPQR